MTSNLLQYLFDFMSILIVVIALLGYYKVKSERNKNSAGDIKSANKNVIKMKECYAEHKKAA